MENNIKNIAIVRLSAIGDIVHSAVVIQFIKKNIPKIKIDWIVEEAFVSLVENISQIDKIHTVNLKSLKKKKSISALINEISSIKKFGNYDLILDMQGLLKSSIVARLIGKNTHGFNFSSSREFLSAFFYKTSSSISYNDNIVKRNCFLTQDALSVDIDNDMVLKKKAIFKTQNFKHLHKLEKQIVFIVGASWKSKIYPKEKILEFCENFKEKIVIIWGSDSEKENAVWICERTSYAVMSPCLSLKELIFLISKSRLLIGNDTGPTHIAWAQNIPSIVLFGPTNARMMQETSTNLSIKSSSCVDIFNINKNDFSIQEIGVDEIIQNTKGLLK